jgi:gliding motility-associated-like protein
VPNDTVVCAGSPLPNLNISFTGKASYSVDLTYNSAPFSITATSNNYSFLSKAGVYQLLAITDANGCSNTNPSKTFTVSQIALPITNYTLSGETACQGTDATLNMSGSELGITYKVYKQGIPRTQIGSFTGNGSALNTTLLSSKLSSGKTIIEVDAMGCAAATLSDTANIVQIGSIAAISGETTICDNFSGIDKLAYTFTPIPGVSKYQWSISGGSVTGTGNTASVDLSTGKAGENYTLSVMAVLANNSLCVNSTASLSIHEVASYGLDTLVISEDSICVGVPILVSIKGRSAEGYQHWHFPAGASVEKTSLLDSTAFIVTANTSDKISVMPTHRCNVLIEALSKNLVVYQIPIVSAGTEQKFNGFPTAAKLSGTHLNPENGVAYQYLWTNTKGSASITSPTSVSTAILPKDVETMYTLTVKTPNEASCSASASTSVKFEIVVTPPLIFSPNEDNKNDLWEITELEFFPDATVEIFNQWGTKVFSKSKGYFAEPWDGKSDGVQVPIATYYYVITPNKPGYASKAGAVTVVR